MRIYFCAHRHQARALGRGLQAALPDADVAAWDAGRAAGRLCRGLGAAAAIPRRAAAACKAHLQHRRRRRRAAASCSCRRRRCWCGSTTRGMSVQMAEYVCHAVIRHFREFDVLRAGDARTASGATASRAAARTSRSASWGWACWASAWRRRCAVRISGAAAGAARRKPARRRAVLRRRGAVRCLPGRQPRAGVPAAADAARPRAS